MASSDLNLEQALARVPLGDAAAFRRVHELTRVYLLSVALRIVGRPELAEDVLQDVYLKVWERAHQYDRSMAQPITWLMSMVRHRAIDVLRVPGNRVADGDDAATDRALDRQTAEAWNGAHDRAQCAIDGARVRAFMHRLSPRHRQSVALAYFDELSHAEVASRMHAPTGSARGWIQRGLRDLRDLMGAQSA
jgi:RNA polymerase sigma-70 factor, ECF subfamily